MKNTIIAIILVCLVSCTKEKGTQQPSLSKGDSYLASVQAALRDSLSAPDYQTLDFNRSVVSAIDSLHIRLVRIPLQGKTFATDFFVVKTDESGHIEKGRFVSVAKDTAKKAAFTGIIVYRSMHSATGRLISYADGRVNTSPTGALAELKAEEPVVDGGNLPPVIVSYTDYGGSFGYADWYNLLEMAGDDGGGYSGYYSPSSGGGGGSGSAPTEQVDFEAPESKEAIIIKKYIDCFGATQDAGATYTVTIAADLPVDNNPGAFFNWSDASPGHTFIEFYKNDNGSLVQQHFGFYPNTSWKTVVGPDNIASKIADDAGHEYQAKYTIAVTAAQFRQALQAAQDYSNFEYNITAFNCADYALGVFNAAGGGLKVPKFQIPGFPNDNGSNTPEGVYDAIQSLLQAGNPNAMANGQKQWAGDSHGACD